MNPWLARDTISHYNILDIVTKVYCAIGCIVQLVLRTMHVEMVRS